MKSKRSKKKRIPLTQTRKLTIVNVLRQLFQWSPERRIALKRDNYTCQTPGCGYHQKPQKGVKNLIRVHHKCKEIDWDIIVEFIRKELLCDPSELIILCKECHDKIHIKSKKPNNQPVLGDIFGADPGLDENQ